VSIERNLSQKVSSLPLASYCGSRFAFHAGKSSLHFVDVYRKLSSRKTQNVSAWHWRIFRTCAPHQTSSRM